MSIYKDGGFFLGIEKDPGRYYISWYDPMEGCFFMTVGANHVPSAPPKGKDSLEDWIADKAVRHLSNGKDDVGYYFHNIREARRALAETNKALLEAFPLQEKYIVPRERVESVQKMLESTRKVAESWRTIAEDSMSLSCSHEAQVSAEEKEEEARLIEKVLYTLLPELGKRNDDLQN